MILSILGRERDSRFGLEFSKTIIEQAQRRPAGDDPRLLPVGCLPLKDPQRAQESLQLALKAGMRAVWFPSDAIEDRTPSHIDYDPLRAMLEEAGVPATLHIGSGRNMPRKYMNTGDEHVIANKMANLETTRQKDLPVIHHSIERWLTCMIYDGVLERFPNLKIGMIELDHFYTKNYSNFLGVDAP